MPSLGGVGGGVAETGDALDDGGDGVGDADESALPCEVGEPGGFIGEELSVALGG